MIEPGNDPAVHLHLTVRQIRLDGRPAAGTASLEQKRQQRALSADAKTFRGHGNRFKVRLGMRPVKVAFRGEIKNPAAAGFSAALSAVPVSEAENGLSGIVPPWAGLSIAPENASRPRPQSQRSAFSARDRKRSDGPEKGGQGDPVRRAALRRPIRLPPKKRQQKSERSGHKSEPGTDFFSFFC